MSKNDTNNALGLDIGTSRIVLARRDGDEFRYESQLNAFVTIPYSKMTEASLKRENVPHSIADGQIVVHGTESERFADLLQVETRRPMTKGVLNPSESDGSKMIRTLIETLTGDAKKGQRVYYSVPAAPMGAQDNLTYHEATLGQVLSDMGFEPKPINEGLAVVYGELEDSNYSGIGISCGGGLCNVCLAYLSVPVVQFSVPKAGDFIDNSAAGVTGELSTRIRLMKEESFHINGHFPDKVHQTLGVYYDDMIRSLVSALKDAFTNSRNIPKLSRPIPLVLSGGSSMPKGFRERFEKVLRESEFPLPLSEIRMARNPLQATAKGALIAALAEA